MGTKHTPGPWYPHATGLARSGLPEFQIHWSEDGECVAEIVHGEADARLIAAAPELLEALLKARRFVVSSHDAVGDELEMIDAAIAKATTEAP